MFIATSGEVSRTKGVLVSYRELVSLACWGDRIELRSIVDRDPHRVATLGGISPWALLDPTGLGDAYGELLVGVVWICLSLARERGRAESEAEGDC